MASKAINTLSKCFELCSHASSQSDSVRHGALPINIYTKEFLNSGNKGGDWDQGWKDQNDIGVKYEGHFMGLSNCCGITHLEQEEHSPTPHEPSLSLPFLCDLNPSRFPTACQSFALTPWEGASAARIPSCRYVFCLEMQNWGNIMMRTRGGQHPRGNNDRCSSTI